MNHDAIALALGEEIAFWRKKRGMARSQLAQRVNTSANTVGRWERGDTSPDVPTTWAIAEALDVDLTTLIKRVQEAHKHSSLIRIPGLGMKDLELQSLVASTLRHVEAEWLRPLLAQALSQASFQFIETPAGVTRYAEALDELVRDLNHGTRRGLLAPDDAERAFVLASPEPDESATDVFELAAAVRSTLDLRSAQSSDQHTSGERDSAQQWFWGDD